MILQYTLRYLLVLGSANLLREFGALRTGMPRSRLIVLTSEHRLAYCGRLIPRLRLEVIEDGTLQNNVRLQPLIPRYIHDIYILNLMYTL